MSDIRVRIGQQNSVKVLASASGGPSSPTAVNVLVELHQLLN